jgi:hypothetical protein
MPRAVRESTAVPAAVSSKRDHPNPRPNTIAEDPEWAWSAPEQLSASIAEINQPISAVVMNAEAALWLLLAQPTDTEAIRRLLDCIVKDGMRTGYIVNRTRALIKKEPAADTDSAS